MKVWVAISMLCLVWSTSFEVAYWKTFMLKYYNTLPYTTPTDNTICWLFTLAEPCSGEAISTLLGLPAPIDTANWTPPTTDTCDTLLDMQRAYAESIATTLFPLSIASAKAAGVANYELMLQFWVLWDGHDYLSKEEPALIALLESVTDWTTVGCTENDFNHDGLTVPRPSYLWNQDCRTLAGAVPAGTFGCGLYLCSPKLYRPCCQQDCSSPCCADTSEEGELCPPK
jgi:hypothetical protein